MLKRDPFTGEIPYFRNLNGDFHSLYHFPFQPAGVWLTVYSMSFVSAASTQTLGLWTWPCCTDTAASSTRSSRWVSTAAPPCAGMPRMQKDRCRMTQSHSRFTLWQWVNLLWDCVILFPLLLLTSNLCFFVCTLPQWLHSSCHLSWRPADWTIWIHSLCSFSKRPYKHWSVLCVHPTPGSTSSAAFTCALQPQTFPGLTRQTCKQKQNGPHF